MSAPSNDFYLGELAQRPVGVVIATDARASDDPIVAISHLLSRREIDQGGELVEMRWERAASAPDDEMRLETVVTRRRVISERTVLLHESVQLVAQAGDCVQHAVLRWHVPNDGRRSRLGDDLGSRAWTEVFAERLATDAEFAQATATFDGTISMAFGDETAALRIYAGKVISSGARTLGAGTFTLAASEREWVALLTADRNEFVRRAARGGLHARGDIFQYLRMTKAVILIIDAARAMHSMEAP